MRTFNKDESKDRYYYVLSIFSPLLILYLPFLRKAGWSWCFEGWNACLFSTHLAAHRSSYSNNNPSKHSPQMKRVPSIAYCSLLYWWQHYQVICTTFVAHRILRYNDLNSTYWRLLLHIAVSTSMTRQLYILTSSIIFYCRDTNARSY